MSKKKVGNPIEDNKNMKELLIPWLRSNGHQVEDLGAHHLDPEDDYPDFAFLVADSVLSGKAERGVVI